MNQETKLQFSKYQEEIFDFVANGNGHGVVIARAGSGKTSTICEALRRLNTDVSVLVLAFNKSIATEISSRVPGHVDVSTVHALGLRAIKRRHPGVRVDAQRDTQIARDSASMYSLGDEDASQLSRLISLAKSNICRDVNQIDEIADKYGFVFSCTQYPQAVLHALETSRAVSGSGSVSFDDMIYIPAVCGYSTGEYDLVVVDEAQDLSLARLAVARQAMRVGGRLICVGDDLQAIYGFAGADSDSMQRIVREQDANVMRLPISYRCPQTIAATVARLYADDFEVPNTAVQGSITKTQNLIPEHGDFVLSRTNAPLVAACLRSLRDGKRVAIQGRDIGAGLMSLVNKSKKINITQFLEWLSAYESRETARAVSKGSAQSSVDAITDKCETLRALCDGLVCTSELSVRISDLFQETDARGKILFSSVHKAKGLEADRVWLLNDTFFLRSGSPQEEKNLHYVAITRSKRDLFLVTQKSL